MIIAPFNLIKPALDKIWHDVLGGVETAWSTIVTFFTGIPQKLLTALGDVVTFLFTPWVKAYTWISTNVIQPVIDFFMTVPQKLVTALGDVVTFVFTSWTKAGAWIDTNVLVPVVTFFSTLPGRVVTALGAVLGVVFAAFLGAGAWIDTNVIQPVVHFFTGLPGQIVTAIGDGTQVLASWGADLVRGVMSGIESIASSIGTAIVGVVKAGWDTATHFLNSLPVVGGLFSAVGLATGGFVTKPTLALVGEAGPEYVIPQAMLIAQYAAGITPLANAPKVGAMPSGSNTPSGVGGNGLVIEVKVEAGAVVISVPEGTSTQGVSTAVNDGFVTLAREISAGVAPLRTTT
jgi:hypothetical protein